MPNYMLLLHSDPATWKTMNPEEYGKALQKFLAWREKLRNQKILVDSNKLKNEAGKVVRRRDRIQVTDGPYCETKEVLGGYFTIQAANYDAAVDECRDCPSLEYGGTIEVREVEAVP